MDDDRSSKGGNAPSLGPPAGTLWSTLSQVRRLFFEARSAGTMRWNGIGEGTVLAESPVPGVLVFTEGGVWRPEGGGELRFRNVFRWTALGPQSIRLEHLRYGPQRPLLLFQLIPSLAEGWHSAQLHLCGADRYGAELWQRDSGIDMRWRITGPRKAETIEYRYRLA